MEDAWVAKALSFVGTCSARSELTLVSQRITRAFRVRRIMARFPTGCQNLMSLAFFLSGDDEAPSSGRPTGISVLQDLGQVDYVRGEGVLLTLDHTVEMAAEGSYLKVYADNQDYYEHAVDVLVQVEVMG